MDLTGYIMWLQKYIIGDRITSDWVLKNYRPYMVQCAKYLQQLNGVNERLVYRGVLLDPKETLETHNLWKFDHVSFTDDKNVAKAFADINSKYGFMIQATHPDYVGHLIRHKVTETDDFIWFDHTWKKGLPKELLEMVKFWNQKELIIGRNINEN